MKIYEHSLQGSSTYLTFLVKVYWSIMTYKQKQCNFFSKRNEFLILNQLLPKAMLFLTSSVTANGFFAKTNKQLLSLLWGVVNDTEDLSTRLSIMAAPQPLQIHLASLHPKIPLIKPLQLLQTHFLTNYIYCNLNCYWTTLYTCMALCKICYMLETTFYSLLFFSLQLLRWASLATCWQ